MSTASLPSRTPGNSYGKISRIFSLTFLPLILLAGLLIALTGCSSVTQATTALPATSVSIQSPSPIQEAPEALHRQLSSGGVLAKG